MWCSLEGLMPVTVDRRGSSPMMRRRRREWQWHSAHHASLASHMTRARFALLMQTGPVKMCRVKLLAQGSLDLWLGLGKRLFSGELSRQDALEERIELVLHQRLIGERRRRHQCIQRLEHDLT